MVVPQFDSSLGCRLTVDISILRWLQNDQLVPANWGTPPCLRSVRAMEVSLVIEQNST